MIRSAAVLGLLFLAACGRREDVAHYQATKDPAWRMLAAIAAGKDATWFFKATGADHLVATHRSAVLAFFKSLKLDQGEVRWTAPAGWLEEKGKPGREASLKIGDHDPRLELSVVRLSGDGGGLLANVNRWREQIGLEKIAEADLAAQAPASAADGLEIRLVDFTGPTRPSMGPRPMARQAEAPPTPSGAPDIERVRSMFAFKLPDGWTQTPNPDKGRIFEFHAGDALITFTLMGGGGGGLAANIDRWRTQVGLEPLGETAVARSAVPISFAGAEGSLVEAIGKDRAILGVMSLFSEFSMFLKMDGTPATVGAQREAFTQFARTFKMGDRHE